MTTPGGEVSLVDPSPAEARQALRDLLRCTPGAAGAGDLELAVGEIVANAVEHGRSPVEVTILPADGSIEVVVRDRGAGPAGAAHPAPPDAERGRGRRLADELAVVRERRTGDGYEVRIRPLPVTGRTRGADGAGG